MSERAYFDWNATAPLREEARTAMLAALALTGNASSVHGEGRAARQVVEAAREKVAKLVGAEAKNVTFTSGATEANMLALTPAISVGGDKSLRDRLFVSAVEHPSVRSGGRFAAERIEELPVTRDGLVDLPALKSALTRAERPLVSVMLANNETGVIQPIRAIADIVHGVGGVLHVDAVQAPGRIDCRMGDLGADLMSLSAHKLGGPQGAGALIGRGEIHIAEPLIKGGGQERGHARGNRECGGHRRLWRRGRCRRTSGGRLAHGGAARAYRERDQGNRAAGGDFRAERAAAAQYDAVCGSRHEGGNRNNRLRSQWDSGIFRFRLLVRQGAGLACAGRHGRGTGAGAGRRAREPRLVNHRTRYRKSARCFD